jgi:hypothetical protein
MSPWKSSIITCRQRLPKEETFRIQERSAVDHVLPAIRAESPGQEIGEPISTPQRHRTTKIIGGTTVLAVIAGLVLWPVANRRWGPYHSITHACVFCGELQRITKRQGKVVERVVVPSDVSRWVQSLHPNHADHTWIMVSAANRESWFDYEQVGCGAGQETTGPYNAFLASQKLGAVEGERYLSDFHAALTLPTDQLVKHVEQMRSEIEAATVP